MKIIILLLLSITSTDIAFSQPGCDIIIPRQSIKSRLNLTNDPPIGANKTITFLEDNTYVFTVADWGFNDPLDEPQNNFLAVKITTLPASGSIKLSGVNVATGQFIMVTSLTAGNLTYIPLLNANGTPYTTFTFQVQDDGGTNNGGVDLDPTPNTITFNVTPVNDAPSFTIGANQTICKNLPAQTVNNWCTNINDGDPETVQTLAFIVTNNNNPLFLVQPSVSPTGTLTYTPATGATGVATLSVRLTDNGGTLNGGINQSAIQMATITIKPDFSWIGMTSSDWFTAANWCSGVPTATSYAIIYPATFQPLVAGANAICSHLTILPTTTLEIKSPSTLTATGQ